MSRRGSKDQLIHLLAVSEAYALREVYDFRLHPAELYEQYRPFSTAELKEWAAGIQARRRGRPRGPALTKTTLTDDVLRDVAKRLPRHSERRACELSARKHGMNPDALRMRIRRGTGR